MSSRSSTCRGRKAVGLASKQRLLLGGITPDTGDSGLCGETRRCARQNSSRIKPGTSTNRTSMSLKVHNILTRP